MFKAKRAIISNDTYVRDIRGCPYIAMTIFGIRTDRSEGLIQTVVYAGDSANLSVRNALAMATALGIEAENITLGLDTSLYPENMPRECESNSTD